MKFNRDIKRLKKNENELFGSVGVINAKVQDNCEFEIYLENVPGDGWCFGSDISGNPLYMKMEDVLKVVQEKGNFTKEDWLPFN